MVKVAYLLSHPVAYQTSMIRQLEKIEGVDFRTIYMSSYGVEKHFDEGFNREISVDNDIITHEKKKILPAFFWGGKRRHFFNPISFGIVHNLFKFRPYVVWVHGYSFYALVFSILFSKLIGAHVVLRGDTNIDEMGNSIKRKILFRIFRSLRIDFFYIGLQNKLVYTSLGIPDKKLFFMPFTVDHQVFSNALKVRRTITNKIRIIYAGKFLLRKNVSMIVRTLAEMSEQERSFFQLTLVGDGECATSLHAMVRSNGLHNCVRFVEPLEQEYLAHEFGQHDVGILPSTQEPWGLIINEYMAAGIIPIVSSSCGCATTLVDHRVNGFIFDPKSTIELRNILLHLKTVDLQDMSRNVSRSIEDYSIAQNTKNLETYLKCRNLL